MCALALFAVIVDSRVACRTLVLRGNVGEGGEGGAGAALMLTDAAVPFGVRLDPGVRGRGMRGGPAPAPTLGLGGIRKERGEVLVLLV